MSTIPPAVLDRPDARWFQVFSGTTGPETECLMLQDVARPVAAPKRAPRRPQGGS